ncbi:MAG: hypothetical protein LBH58_04410 [Tannerellaceae bacterium]|jgi:hypothetical protein|nr:hypothetical protein [Tannerellaceae bacterium]
MDKLKKFIHTNREAFDNDPLPAGHFKRFEKKLPTPPKKQIKWINVFSIAIAAVVTLFVFIRIQSDMKDTSLEQSGMYTCETQKEFDELRFYYNMQIDELWVQIRTLCKSEQSSGGLELLEETKRVIKSTHDFEENVLPILPCSDDGLFAMNQHYRNSLASLNIMLKQMEYVTDSKHN